MQRGEALHKIPLARLVKSLGSSKSGLSANQAREKLEEYGYNKLSEKRKTPLLLRFILQFKNFFSILLLVGAALSFLGEYITPGEHSGFVGLVLIGVTILNALFTFFQEYKAEQAMKSFRNLISQNVTVLRDGKEQVIKARYVVPGDIISLREGEKIPADARIIEEHLLKVDHSMLTGESEPQLRSIHPTSDKELLSRNMVFSGTLVQSGSGKALVLRTGDLTEIGKIAHLTTTVKKRASKIKQELKVFVSLISTIAIILGIVFFGMGVFIGRSFWESIIFGIGIIVANVPEGLLPTVTLTLSLAGQKMAKDKALVKDIEAIETLGGITVICTDKTGTLTKNKLTTRYIYYDQVLHEYNLEHKTFYDKEKVHYLHAVTDDHFDAILDVLYLCNNSFIDEEGKGNGDPTELALREIVLTQKNKNLYLDAHREQELPFDSEKKYMVVTAKHDGERKAYMKGSPKVVLEKCTHYIHKGKLTKLSPAVKQELLSQNSALASDGQRVLALAHKKLKGLASEAFLAENDYIFLGLVALQDPPREEVAQAVQECYEAGIKIIVISGDQGETVVAIAKQTGIIKANAKALIIASDELAKLDDKQLKHILKSKYIIFSRSLPSDKLRVVRALQEMGEIVAVTGDGVNDAPALKQADVGVAMGKTGTDVAKEAANMVLLDDNFATIVKAIKRGRTVFENIKKFISYILTSNIPEILPFLFFVIFGWPLALPILLILAIDLGTDMLPAISLGVEKAETDVMKRAPRKVDAKLLTKRMLIKSYGLIGMIQATTSFVVFFIILYSGGWSFGQPLAGTDPLYYAAVGGFFASIIITQVFDLLSCRTTRMPAMVRSPLKNKVFIWGVLVELGLLSIIILFKPAQRLFGTAPFSPWLLLVMVGGGLLIYYLEELRKYLYRTRGIFDVN